MGLKSRKIITLNPELSSLPSFSRNLSTPGTKRRFTQKKDYLRSCFFEVSYKRRLVKITSSKKRLGNTEFHILFISNTFISDARLKLAKNQANAKQHPETELLLF